MCVLYYYCMSHAKLWITLYSRHKMLDYNLLYFQLFNLFPCTLLKIYLHWFRFESTLIKITVNLNEHNSPGVMA